MPYFMAYLLVKMENLNEVLPPQMIIMVGPPASGKSTVAQEYISKDFVHINQDTLRTLEKCLQLAQLAIFLNKSMIIDNTNPNLTVRKPYLEMTRGTNYKKIAIVMETPKSLCQLLNSSRSAKSSVPLVPAIAYNIFYKKYEKPTESEGFDEIITREIKL